MTTNRTAVRSVGARHAVPGSSIAPTPTVNLTPLNATLTRFAVTAANKRLTKTLSPLNATLTKYQEGPFDTCGRISIDLVGAQHAAPLPSGLPMISHFSPVTSHQSRVTYP
jgi:hypothetical protein